MKTQHIAGKLTATRTDKITPNTHRDVYLAVNKNALYAITEPAKWDYGILNLSRQVSVIDGTDAGHEFMNQLTNFLTEKGVAELELKGEVTVMTSGEEPAIYRILVENNQVVSYHAALTWTKEPVTV